MIQHNLMLLHDSKLSPTIAADASSRYESARRLVRRWEKRQCRSVQPIMGTMQNRPNLLLPINFLTSPVWVAFGPQFRRSQSKKACVRQEDGAVVQTK